MLETSYIQIYVCLPYCSLDKTLKQSVPNSTIQKKEKLQTMSEEVLSNGNFHIQKGCCNQNTYLDPD